MNRNGIVLIDKKMPISIKISIAMCTYNGEKYLQEQLDSFLQQTRLPDELVVCDDGSQDGTMAMLDAFAAKAPFPVRIFINPQNLGFIKNFEKAISFCQGDIIALSDQDDVWLPEKLARFERLFLEDLQLGYVFSDSTLVDEDSKPLGCSHWEFLKFTSPLQKSFSQNDIPSLLLETNYVSGASMAFRSNLRDLVLPIPIFWMHDHWIAFVLRIFMKTALIPDHLYKYRQHSSQSIGARAPSLPRKFRVIFKMDREARNRRVIRLNAALVYLLSDSRLRNNKLLLEYIRDIIEHSNVRANLPDSRIQRFPILFRELFSGRYHKYSFGSKDIVKDILSGWLD